HPRLRKQKVAAAVVQMKMRVDHACDRFGRNPGPPEAIEQNRIMLGKSGVYDDMQAVRIGEQHRTGLQRQTRHQHLHVPTRRPCAVPVPTHAAPAKGRCTVKLLPWPGELETSTEPPWVSATHLTIGKPSPHPSTPASLRVRLLSAR